MTKNRKIELLYKKAKGKRLDATKMELQEINHYRVGFGEGDFYTTKNNIRDYVNAVDKLGCKISFYDWCMNNNRADRRRKGGSEQAVANSNSEANMAVMLLGWVTWGMAIYWMFQEMLSVGICAVLGAIISRFLYKRSRVNAMGTVILLPIFIAVFFGMQ